MGTKYLILILTKKVWTKAPYSVDGGYLVHTFYTYKIVKKQSTFIIFRKKKGVAKYATPNLFNQINIR